jgi:hypothetical protein
LKEIIKTLRMLSTRRFRLSILAVLALWSLTILVEFHRVDALIQEQQDEECNLNEHGECINPEALADNTAEAKEEETVSELMDEKEVASEEAEPELAQATEEGSIEEEETPGPVTQEEESLTEDDAEPVEEEPVIQVDPVEEARTLVEEETDLEKVTDKTDTTVTDVAEEEETPNCPSRKHVIKCAGEYLDTNKNSLLERAELQAAIDKLPWWSRGILSILGSVDKMMAKCDVDGDGAIGMGYDMENSKEHCLATCFKRRAFKSAFFPDCEA